MPVILEPEQFDLWLDPVVQDPERLKPLLASHLPKSFEAVAVSTRVNKPEHDEPDCITPLVETGGQLSL
jgi:putative SOS response-associated peptidase YedK